MELKELKGVKGVKDNTYAAVFSVTTGIFCGKSFVFNSLNSFNSFNS